MNTNADVPDDLPPPDTEDVWEESGERDLVPISAIEHYSYCPRQCALIYIEQTFEENVFTIRAQEVHERVDEGDDSAASDVQVYRSLSLWSKRLGVIGKSDVVEMQAGGPYPVEYKPGRRHGIHADLQLCAQALCLEEMLNVAVPRGALYYFGTRSRHDVVLDEALRQKTRQVILAVRDMLRTQRMPPPLNDAHCPNCSLVEVCMPAVLGEPARLRGLQSTLFSIYDDEDERDKNA